MRLLSVLLVAIALPAAADPVPPTPGPDPAREHYERGLAKYNLAEFDAAIVEFKQSYELSKAPRLLFNIAQAYRLKKDYESALYFYSTYLRADPNPPNLSDVNDKIDEMQRAVDEQHRKAAASSGTTTTSTTDGKAAAGNDRRAARRPLLIAGIAVAAVGVGALGVGGGMLGLSSSDAGKLHGVAVAGMPWTAADQAMYDEGSRAQTAGIVLLSVGGALVIGGGVAAIVALRR
jgi:tetratricopeptide (TPR) repeat protein